jgi:aspartyl-tRNA(Asn)/glutamyl-tRNA(Gln) amidotransferase subunit A
MTCYLSGYELHQRFTQSSLSAEEIALAFLQQSQSLDPKVKAFLEISQDTFLEQAKALDRKRASGAKLGKLAGVPIGIKDNIHLKDHVSTCGSKILGRFKAPFSATAVEKLAQEDALFIGKLNMDEFGMGSSTENSAFFPTANPWDLNRVPGGSSGGSAAAVSARMAPITLGSDTGGSIRQPASFCGIFGYKPSYGRVSRWGLVAFASSLDVIGPLAHDLRDIAMCMEVMGAPCQYDSTCLSKPSEDYHLSSLSQIQAAPKLRIGVPFQFLEELNQEAKAHFLQSCEKLKSAGCEIIDVNLDILRHSLAVYYIIATAEAATNLARFDGIRYGARSTRAQTLDEVYRFSREEGFGKEVKRRILMGNFSLSSDNQDAYFRKAQRVRQLIIDRYKEAFESCDYIAMPTTPTPAFEIGAIHDPLQMYLGDIYTISVNLAALPTLSIPTGLNPQGLPLGIQLLAPHGKDRDLILHSLSLCQSCDWSSQVPPMIAKHSNATPRM